MFTCSLPIEWHMIPRASVYHMPVPISLTEVALMRLIVEIRTAYPFYGSHKIRDDLWAKDIVMVSTTADECSVIVTSLSKFRKEFFHEGLREVYENCRSFPTQPVFRLNLHQLYT